MDINVIIFTVATLSVLGLVLAVILYYVAQKFKVEEDPRIDEIEACLPGANCGGCGNAGCRAFAESVVKAGNLDSNYCPVGGNAVMKKVAEKLGVEIVEKEPMVAVVRCTGNCEKRPLTVEYDGLSSCRVKASLISSDTGCSFGCLGEGDCEDACNFGAIKINPETRLPEVNEDLCTACGACVKACPKSIIELRKKGPKSRRVYVACRNQDKGGVARKACTGACIGCGKCAKTCPFGAITVENNLAYIDFNLCKSCRKCAEVCPTGAIVDVNFPPRPVKPAGPVKPVASAAPVAPATPAAPVAETKEVPAEKTVA